MSDLGFDPTLKKKKKAKKPEDEALPAAEGADDMFAGLKKKKKTKKPEGDDLLEASFDELSLKKKKKKTKTTGDAADDFDAQLEEAGIEEPIAEASVVQEESALPYEVLLLRFFGILKKNNPELAGDRLGPKFKIPPPVCQREGSKKTMFANVQEIATVLQRNPEHLIQFLFAELGTSGSIDGEKRLILKGKFLPKQMESVLRRYIVEYVTCKTCKSMNTELKRESANRLHFLSCKACGSTRSVTSIKTGFQAQIGRRKRM